MSAPLILLASYPKSGNTWLRMVLSNLLYADEAPISINDIRVGGFRCDRRELFDQLAPWSASDLNRAEVDCLLPDVYRDALAETKAPVYLKTHDMARRNRDGAWLFPPECVQGVLHIVRHPLDVLPSYAKHFGLSHADALAQMLDPDGRPAKAQLADKRRLPEYHGGWLSHTRSWYDPALPYPVIHARYEDLRRDPQAEFGRLLRGIGLTFTDEALTVALAHSSFQALQQQEAAHGFRERLGRSQAPFFRKGEVGSGRQEIAPDLQEQLYAAVGDTLADYGYQ